MPDFRPVQGKRHFTRNKLYCEIDWTNFPEIVAAYRSRIEGWYLRPAQKLRASSGHYGFSVVALSCMLVDTVAQYVYWLEESDGDKFKTVLRDHDEVYRTPLSPPIRYTREGKPKQLCDYAEVLWVCYRCGILHESHVKLCAAIVGGKRIMWHDPTGSTLYSTGQNCPTVILDPGKFLSSVESLFLGYIRRLRDKSAAHNQLRSNFAKKFQASFGVSISTRL